MHAAGFEVLVFFSGHVPDFIHPGHAAGFPVGSETTAGKEAEDGSGNEEEEKYLHEEERHEPGEGSEQETAEDGFEDLRFHFLYC